LNLLAWNLIENPKGWFKIFQKFKAVLEFYFFSDPPEEDRYGIGFIAFSKATRHLSPSLSVSGTLSREMENKHTHIHKRQMGQQ